jgi:hypothetical protein
MRRRILIAVLTLGVVGGYGSGIYRAVTHGDDDGGHRRGCKNARWAAQE